MQTPTEVLSALRGSLGDAVLVHALGVEEVADFERFASAPSAFRGTQIFRRVCRLLCAEGLPLIHPLDNSGVVGRVPFGGPFWQRMYARAGGVTPFLENHLRVQKTTLRGWVDFGVPYNKIGEIARIAGTLGLSEEPVGVCRLRDKWFAVDCWNDVEPLRGVRPLSELVGAP